MMLVVKITILVNAVTDSLINNPASQTPYGCKFSIQYCVACALQYGKVTPEHFTAEAVKAPELRPLMGKIKARRDASVQAVYDADNAKLASKVVVECKDGRKAEKLVEFPKGDPANPMTWEESREKFLSLSVPVVGDGKANRLAELAENLEAVEDFAAALRSVL